MTGILSALGLYLSSLLLLSTLPSMRALSVRLASGNRRRLGVLHCRFQHPTQRHFSALSTNPPELFHHPKIHNALLRRDSSERIANDAPRSPLVPLQASSNNFSDGEGTENDNIRTLEEEIASLNNGEHINVNSQKQVSMAIFGRIQSTSRKALLEVAQGNYVDQETGSPLSDQTQRLAALVLDCRAHRKSSCTDKKKGKDEKIFQNYKQEEPTTQLPIGEISSDRLSRQAFEGNPNDPSQYDKLVDSLFDRKGCQVDECWRNPLKQITRPSAKALVAQLDPSGCPLGYNHLASAKNPQATSSTVVGQKGSFLAFCRDAKEKHKDCIVVTRCGDFYETFGIDAIMLVEHCGLNAMGGKCKAGFPFRNIQASLDSFTQKGFRVAVYEEVADTDASGVEAKAGSKSRLKTRMLAQIISPASPTYMFDLIMLGNSADTLATGITARPYMGVISLKNGYTLVEVSMEERSVRVSERLTKEAVACRISAYPPVSPLLLVPSPTEYQSHNKGYRRMAPFLPNGEPGSSLSLKVIPPSLVQEPRAGTSDIERARSTIVSALLQMTGVEESDPEEFLQKRRTTLNDFTLVASSSYNDDKVDSSEIKSSKTQTHPLHVETATQLGLMDDKAIPKLMAYLLPDSAPVSTRRFLRRYLLNPPPPEVCEAMSTLVSFLKEDTTSLPPLSVVPLGKVLSLLREGQASAGVYGEILASMAATMMVLEQSTTSAKWSVSLIEPLMTILEHESGMAAEPQSLQRRCKDAMEMIEMVVSPMHHNHAANSPQQHSEEDHISDFGDFIPSAFTERNEAVWRGLVQPSVVKESYGQVEDSARRLAQAVAKDFFGVSLEAFSELAVGKNPIVQDVNDNLIALKEIPSWAASTEKEHKYIHPRDRNGKILKNRYTTDDVKSALADYVTACESARDSVVAVLKKLSQDLYDHGHVPAIAQAAHANLILSSAFHHAREANARGWNCVEVYEASDLQEKYRQSAAHFNNVWPYWMGRSTAVPNTFEMKDLFLLTAPNMSGKSTIMRTVASCLLLASVGLCAPCGEGTKVRRFDHVFVRGASSDIPAENKSAFGAEMGDIAALLRVCGPKSVVCVDELCRGTSPKDGTRLAGAVLETMAKSGMSGFFATHLHDILELPLDANGRIATKRMAIHDEEDGDSNDDGEGSYPSYEPDRCYQSDYKWTYRLADGVCTDSMALVTAAQFGLPKHVLERADALLPFVKRGSTRAEGDGPLQENRLTNDTHAINGSDQIIASAFDGKKNGDHVNFDAHHLFDDAMNTTGKDPIQIPPGWYPPAPLEGQSCVYVLRLPSLSLEDSPPSYYVGETDSFQKRLQQHRAKGGEWSVAEAFVFSIPDGKSEARALENILIKKLVRLGLEVRSTQDGRADRLSQQNYSSS